MTPASRLETGLEEDERVALAASSEYDRAATEPEHWRWECDTDDTPVNPDLAIAGGEEFLGHNDEHHRYYPHYRIGLRSTESYPSRVPGMRPLVHLALNGCEEVTPQVARHITRHDPARAVRLAAAHREILAAYHAADGNSPSDRMRGRWDALHEVIQALAGVYAPERPA